MNFNRLKTLYLIARVTPPYQQSGSDAKRLLILGDSTGYGTGATRSSESVAGQIGAAFPALAIVNKSANGRTAAQLTRYVQNFTGFYDVILLQIGANDLLRHTPPAEVVKRVEILVKRLSPHTKQLIVMTASNIGAAPRFDRKTKEVYTMASRIYENLMAELALNTKTFTFVKLFTEPEFDPFVLHPEINTSCDGLHPTSAGYRLWYEALKSHLVEI